MSKFWHGLLHVGAIVVNLSTLYYGLLPPPYNLIASAVLGGTQAGVALYNHGKGK